jgi:hypothetical protein
LGGDRHPNLGGRNVAVLETGRHGQRPARKARALRHVLSGGRGRSGEFPLSSEHEDELLSMGQPASVRDRTLARPFPPTHRRMASRSRTTKSSAARGPQGTARPGADPIYRQRGRQGIRESIPHEVASLSYTQEVTGSSPVPPAAIKPLQIDRNGCRCERRRMPRWWGLGCIRRAPGFFGSRVNAGQRRPL